MGMFDDIHLYGKKAIKCMCGEELKHFQTKQFDCMMTQYRVINKRFEVEVAHYRDPKPSETREVCGMTLPIAVKERTGWKKITGTDTINCYEMCRKCQAWIDVEIVLIKGKIDSIKHWIKPNTSQS